MEKQKYQENKEPSWAPLSSPPPPAPHEPLFPSFPLDPTITPHRKSPMKGFPLWNPKRSGTYPDFAVELNKDWGGEQEVRVGNKPICAVSTSDFGEMREGLKKCGSICTARGFCWDFGFWRRRLELENSIIA